MDVYEPFIALTRMHAREAVDRLRSGAETEPTHVWLLWAGVHSVLGVYGSEASAQEELDLIHACTQFVDAWIEKRQVKA